MDFRTHGYIVGVAGFFYGTVGYGLSIATCIVGAALRQFFPEFTFTQLPARKSPIIVQGSKTRKRRRGPSPSKRTPSPRISKSISGPTANTSLAIERIRPLQPPPDTDRLRRVSSLDSFVPQQSFVLVAPVITINHVDRVDNTSIHAPTITILPSSTQQPESKPTSKRRSLTIAHPPSLPDLPRLPSGEEARPACTFRLSSLKPFWGGEKAKPKIHRSASSPQLDKFILEKLPSSDSKKENSQEDKVQPTLSERSSKKALRPEKNLESASSQSSPSKFFSAFPKSVEKKRSQVLRTQPYEAPYFVPPPVPPPPLDDIRRAKGGKRGHTLPPEKLVRPSTAPQRLPRSENI